MSKSETIDPFISLRNREKRDFMDGYQAGLEAALQFVISYPSAWKLDHRVIELQEDVVDETCLHIESSIRQYMKCCHG